MASVVPVSDEIDGSVVEVQVGKNRRVTREEIAEDRQHICTPESDAYAHLQRSRRCAAVLRGMREGIPQLVEGRPDLVEKALAAVGQCEAARASMKEPQPQLLFEPGDVLTDASRRHAEPASGGGEAPGLRGDDKRLHEVQRFHGAPLTVG